MFCASTPNLTCDQLHIALSKMRYRSVEYGIYLFCSMLIARNLFIAGIEYDTLEDYLRSNEVKGLKGDIQESGSKNNSSPRSEEKYSVTPSKFSSNIS